MCECECDSIVMRRLLPLLLRVVVANEWRWTDAATDDERQLYPPLLPVRLVCLRYSLVRVLVSLFAVMLLLVFCCCCYLAASSEMLLRVSSNVNDLPVVVAENRLAVRILETQVVSYRCRSSLECAIVVHQQSTDRRHATMYQQQQLQQLV